MAHVTFTTILIEGRNITFIKRIDEQWGDELRLGIGGLDKNVFYMRWWYIISIDHLLGYWGDPSTVLCETDK